MSGFPKESIRGFKKARISAGLTVSEVCKELGVSDAAVYSWETGKWLPTGKRLLEVAKLYGCTTDELLSEEEVKTYARCD